MSVVAYVLLTVAVFAVLGYCAKAGRKAMSRAAIDEAMRERMSYATHRAHEEERRA